ncbi:MAG: DEAD/DEAH box helicase, partial [Nitrosopumilaceae archaeon]|nr:DEAD/DEAH box helicase [Nitrosopumilaceae archaeon]
MCILPLLVKTQKAYQNYTLQGTTYMTKIDSLVQTILTRKDNQRPKLIFCHFRGEIDMIKKRLENDFEIQTIDGRISTKQKKEILSNSSNTIDDKKTTNKILILQIQTCSEGLNLQEYNEVYFVSPHWNPAIESQAIARCHRLGQTSDVDVFRFIMTWNDKSLKSMDEYCDELQIAKRKMYSEFFSQQTTI